MEFTLQNYLDRGFMEKKRNISLDAVKGFAIILVMIGHVLVRNGIEDPYIYNMIKAVQMPLFMIVSSYITGIKQPINSKELYLKTMKRRATVYLLPFFSWLLVQHHEFDYFIGTYQTLFNLQSGMWFLMTLFILNVMLYTAQLLSSPFEKKGRLQGFIAFCVAFGLIALVPLIQRIIGNTFLSPDLTVYYMPFFVTGYIVRRYEDVFAKVFNKVIQKIGVIIAILIYFLLCIKYNFSTSSNRLVAIFQMIAGFTGSYFIIWMFLNTKVNAFKEKLAQLGRYTLEIYVVHVWFATVLNRGTINFTLYSVQGIIFAVASFVAMSAITAIFIYVTKKIKYLSLLLYGRK